MEFSEFLAKLLGLYFGIFGVLCIFRNHQIQTMAKDLSSSKSALAVSAEFSLVFGLVIAIDHTIWEYSFRGLITLIGYLLILRAIIRFAFPEEVKKFFSKITEQGWWLIAIVCIVIGAFLTYSGMMVME